MFWGIYGSVRARTADGYFLAGRQLPAWVFILAATATSFSGWTFIGHPGLVYRDGLSYAFASLYAITIPTTNIAALIQDDGRRTPQGYCHYVAIPGVIQFVSNGPDAQGGPGPG